ncbi:MAG: HAD hydrolase family protein [Deltaproteobacteria bacterium]|nr:HAD hydrolase family protein [Deltaproteobacteria bacterium]
MDNVLFQKKIEAIRLFILDVDGVLTDGRIIMDDDGREIKHFDVRDGHGLKLLKRYGIEAVILSGRKSAVVEHRARDLGIEEVHQGIWNKVEVSESILKNRNLQYDQIAFMGDDIVDIPLLRRVGFSVAVADAAEEVKRIVDYVTQKKGGRGAVREVCEVILLAQDKWADVAARYELY